MDEAVGVGVGPAERGHHAGGDEPTPGHRRRTSARRKQEAVLCLLRGEELDLLSRELGATADNCVPPQLGACPSNVLDGGGED